MQSNVMEANSAWELRQKHAAFFQAAIGPVQQGAIASSTSAALLLTLGGVLAKFSGVAGSQDWMILFFAVIGWGILSAVLVASFARSAVRIEKAYLAEHAELFPGVKPYALETFLFDFANRNPWLSGRRAAVSAY